MPPPPQAVNASLAPFFHFSFFRGVFVFVLNPPLASGFFFLANRAVWPPARPDCPSPPCLDGRRANSRDGLSPGQSKTSRSHSAHLASRPARVGSALSRARKKKPDARGYVVYRRRPDHKWRLMKCV